MTYPNPRGSLTNRTKFITQEVDPDAPIDYFPHFPAGPRSTEPGIGRRHQRKNAGPKGWVPFNPFDRRMAWRASICGDRLDGPYQHLKGGAYYYNGKIVKQYRSGGTISLTLGIIAHHNGFMELHACDVGKCPGGDISPKCFWQGHCVKLERAWVKECEGGYSRRCGPIDKKHPGRWYFPCYGYPNRSKNIARYGGKGTIKYKIPRNFKCNHCVLHWYWTSANSCNPPGVVEYFDGPDRPRGWGNCRGQAGARGGVARNQKPCGGRAKVPEEYMSCADIRINPRAPTHSPSPSPAEPSKSASPNPKPRPNRAQPNPKPSRSRRPTPSPSPRQKRLTPSPVAQPTKKRTKKRTPKQGYDEAAAYRRGYRAVRDIILVDRGQRVASLNTVNRVRVHKTSRFSIEALVEPRVKKVAFRVNGRPVFTDLATPFYIKGNTRKKYPIAWNPPTNKWLTVTVYANGDTDSVRVYFEK